MDQLGSVRGLGPELGQLRRARGIPQGELARRLGMSAANLSRIEHGSDFRVSTLLDIARELRLEPVLVPKPMLPAVRHLIDPQPDEAPERGRFA
jgi:transcriptional regulator with XRE-family HTH domain